jgi:hypothetical protein
MSAMHHLSPNRVVVALRCKWAWLMNTGYHPEQHYMRAASERDEMAGGGGLMRSAEGDRDLESQEGQRRRVR